ncbi:response regulator [Sphingomonas psychrotolerans]|uniref:Response regulator n=1 Tax=Sphingomonas psychrotolerans TaxID=1327635 RepID=A0A2K8MK54_9SPHN|nr:response regulator [Sphingomonas psychrotolerans]ATY34257.1 response regulator [Sphingomonas psychrotolerans]
MSGYRGLRVLVVEDEPVVAMFLEDILQGLGCETVGPAGRLTEGLALAEHEILGAAILDINLAGERSTPIAAALLRRGIPVAFASGYGAAPEGFERLPLIEKPYREADIDAVLMLLTAT